MDLAASERVKGSCSESFRIDLMVKGGDGGVTDIVYGAIF